MIISYIEAYRRYRDRLKRNGLFYTRFLPEFIFFFAIPQAIFFPAGVLLSSIAGLHFLAIFLSLILPLLLFFWRIKDRKRK